MMAKMELKHKEEIVKLAKLGQYLIKLISDTNNDLLKGKFLEWQAQRNKCNLVYNEWIAEILKGKE